MKKLLLFLFLPLFLLSGCKDDDEDDPKTIAEQLQGTWNITSQQYDYYNSSNTKVYQESVPAGGTVTFSGQNVSVELGGITIPGTYITSETNGKKNLSITVQGSTDNVEITTLTDKNMTWQTETPNDPYDEGGVTKTSAKSISTVQLQKQ